jgi:hypothetical protein
MAEEPNRWESVYKNKEEAVTSWYEDRPQVWLGCRQTDANQSLQGQ